MFAKGANTFVHDCVICKQSLCWMHLFDSAVWTGIINELLVQVPCSAALKPCTSLEEFSAKKRCRYMMRTSAWKSRLSTSGESLMRTPKPSAAWDPNAGSVNREKSWNTESNLTPSVWSRTGETGDETNTTWSVRAEDSGWYRKSRALATCAKKRVYLSLTDHMHQW